MEIRKFKSLYELDLIPASHEGISLGDLVWDPVFGPPQFTKKGMPGSIYSAFLDAGLISENEWAALGEESNKTEFIQAHLASRTVEVDVSQINELKHPDLGNISADFLSANLSKFTFGNIRVKEMSDLLRIRIDRYLEQMKANKWHEYDGRIRRVYLITELYYGSIKMVVEKKFSAEMEAMFKNSGLSLSSKSEGSQDVEYEFSNMHVPFAMRIEMVRHFNG